MFLLVSSGCCSLLGALRCVATIRHCSPCFCQSCPSMTYTVCGLLCAPDTISASNATCCNPGCEDSDWARSILIRRAFSPIQKATSVSAPASPVCITTRAAGLLLYSARNLAASPASTAAFHCSTGANGAGTVGATICALAVSTKARTKNVVGAAVEIRCVTLIRGYYFILSY